MTVSRGKQFGFTLLEVLLAGFILFSVLTTSTLVYKGTALSSSKAEKSLRLSAIVPTIRQTVSQNFHGSGYRDALRGEGNFDGLEYEWEATLVQRGSRLSPGDGYLSQYFLWEVELTVSQGNLMRNYTYRDIGW